MPAGWTARSSGSGVGWWSRVGQVDRRDPSGRLLVRVRNQPATGETEDGSLLAVIAGCGAVPGAVVAVRHAPHQARICLREADWTVDVPVGGRPRVAQVSAWLLNGQVITVYTMRTAFRRRPASRRGRPIPGLSRSIPDNAAARRPRRQ